MKFNQLPDGYDATRLGPQKRKTEFKSKGRKLTYDATNLIAKARMSFQTVGVEIASREQILMAIQIIVGASRKDYDKALEGAINAILDTQERKAEPEQAGTDKEKLKAMMSSESYQKSVAAAKEMDPTGRIPTHEQIIAELMKYSPERLGEICEMMEKPTLLIVPATSFDEKLNAMNANKHYTSADGKAQEDLFIDKRIGSPYLEVPRKKKGRVSIVDGVVHPAQLAGVSPELYERREHLTAKFGAKNMRNIGGDEMAVLLQQSLIEAEETHDNSKIIDNWESGTGTVTILDPGSLTNSTSVAFTDFDSNARRVDFFCGNPDGEDDSARGRASLQVMEF